ncbi:hypothetical protein BCR44DRAFT_1136794 [Catenaria anguillulae PL171]|uniref:AMP-dependent synthetase/ligase domain-containing protein n=1 Tax=Catenaria anguillulae PL171 TaxID=765915 RepID=A0A1Y2HMF1_9FUNG|nr:hypothetical protein BCR44DRAFT_1136794 [Catenaria anguillulae PL171]
MLDAAFNLIEGLGGYLAPVVVSLVSLPILSLFLYQRPSGRNVTAKIPAKSAGVSYRLRHHKAKDGLIATPDNKIRSVHDVLEFAAREHGDAPMLGSRKALKVHEEQKEVVKIVAGQEVRETKKWQFSELSTYHWMTASEVLTKSKAIGSALAGLGFQPKDKACIFAPTSPEWRLFAHGCFSQSITIATAYDTLGAPGLLHALNEPQIPVVFTHASLFPVLTSILGKTTDLRHIVYFGQPTSPDHLAQLEAAAKTRGMTIFTLDELIATGLSDPRETRPPSPSDLCCIMYTSGSTGNPKGVMLTHGNIVAALGGIKAVLAGILTSNDTYLAFLPLAHVMEFAVESYLLYIGAKLGYGSPRTLTDASVRNCKGDIAELRPTVLAGVPVVWDTIRKGILGKVGLMKPIVQRVFWMMYKLKKFALLNGVPVGWIADAIVFNKVKAQTGGRLRFGLSGGAPISEDTQMFLSVAVCPIVQGYGLTEVCAMTALYSPEVGFELRAVGPPVACSEIQLVDVPEAGYLTSQNPPRGEVWVRGPSVSQGYFNQPKATAEAFTEDGWLMTGDIGQFNANGTLSVIDRKKNLIKLSNGEYIALEKLESVYAGSKYVARICVYADSLRSYPLAIVQPVPAAIEALAKANGIAFDSWEQLCHQKLIASAILDDLKAIAKSNKFVAAEVVQAVVLADEEWTPQSGMLTAAMKLKRRELVDHYKRDIEKAYV